MPRLPGPSPMATRRSWLRSAFSLRRWPHPAPSARWVRLAGAAAGAALVSAVLVPATISTPAGAVAETAWSVVASPNVPSADLDALAGIACASARSCLAVGSYEDANKLYKTLAQEWDGTKWSIVPSPNEGPALDDKYFVGVSCASESACMAVGAYANSNFVGKTLIESWDGTRWSPSPSVDEGPASMSNDLSGISCASAKSCMAVGSVEDGTGSGGIKTLAEEWDGTRWSVVPSADQPSSDDNELFAVDCPSTNSCTAVGDYYRSGLKSTGTLVETWDGTEWSIVPSPDGGQARSVLTGVSCVSAGFCTAVGWYAVSKDAPDKTLVESSHRTSWSVVPSPNEGPAADDKHLDGVSCVSARACAAVGYYADVEFVGKTLIESWDGTSWSVVPSANRGPATDSSELSGVSCVSATSCIASGSEHMGLSRGQTLVERR